MSTSIVRSILLLSALCAIPALLYGEPIHVEGVVLSQNGRPVVSGHVHLYPYIYRYAPVTFEGELSRTEIAPDGRWSLELPDVGYYQLIFTSPDHQWKRVDLPLDGSETDFEFTVTLDYYLYDGPRPPGIIGSFNNFDFDNPVMLTQGEDLRWRGEITSQNSEEEIQLVGSFGTGEDISRLRSVNLPPTIVADGTEQKRTFRYDEGGDYVSIVPVVDGKVEIVVDIPYLRNRFSVPSAASGSDVNRAGSSGKEDLLAEIEEMLNRIQQKENELELAAKGIIDTVAAVSREEAKRQINSLVVDFDTRLQEEMWGIIHSDAPLSIRRIAAVQLASIEKDIASKSRGTTPLDTEGLKEVRALLSPTSIWWELDPYALYTIYPLDSVGTPGWHRSLEDLAQKSGSPLVRGDALARLTIRAAGLNYGVATVSYYSGKLRHEQTLSFPNDTLQPDSAEYLALYNRLDRDFGHHSHFSMVLKELDPHRAIMIGKPVPPFRFAIASGESGDTVSSRSMKGKYYLIDLWATWCGPCVADQPWLQKAYEKYGGERFEIISVSFDQSWETVEAFRKETYPMPWIHAFADEDISSDIWEAFEMQGVPRVLLIDPEGLIVGVDYELRGEALLKRLGKVLGDQ